MTQLKDIPVGTDLTLSTEGIPIGAVIPYAGAALPAGGKWDWADGGLIDRTTFAGFFNTVGHAYNGGADPGNNKVRKPDKRGRVPVGADNFGAGAAGRLPNSNRAIGQSGGEERHLLTSGESGTNGNATAATSNPGDHRHNPQNANGGGFWQNQPDGASVMWWANDGSSRPFRWEPYTDPAGGHTHSVTLNARGADGSHNNLQPYECDNYIVRVA